MARQMDYAPPPPPSIERPYRNDGGLQRPDFASSDQLMAQMPEFLRTFFRNKKVERPETLEPTLAQLNIPVPQGQQPGGLYFGQGRVAIPRTNEAQAVPSLEHELLHALANEHPRFRRDLAPGWPAYAGLRGAMADQPQDDDLARSIRDNDWQHVFTQLARMAMRDPDRLTFGTQNYFAPMLPPTQVGRGPR